MLLCGIIKPHALAHSEEILDALISAEVKIHETRPVRFTHELIDILYDHMSDAARDAIGKRLIGLSGTSVLLEVSSIERLLEIVGRDSDPQKCVGDSIRARFGAHVPPTYVGEDMWWENAFHRPVDAREAARDLLHIFSTQADSL